MQKYKCYLYDIENWVFLFNFAKVKHPFLDNFLTSAKSKECFGIFRTSAFQKWYQFFMMQFLQWVKNASFDKKCKKVTPFSAFFRQKCQFPSPNLFQFWSLWNPPDLYRCQEVIPRPVPTPEPIAPLGPLCLVLMIHVWGSKYAKYIIWKVDTWT